MFCKEQKGQILLIAVLVVIVASTIGLSLASRSITSLRSSTEEVESQKALAAAEAGIERAIQGNVSINLPRTDLTNNSHYEANITSVNGASFLLNGGKSVPKDEGADLWLSNYSADPNLIFASPWSGTLTIYWGTDSTDSCKNPALEIIIVSGAKSSPVSKRYAFDPCQSRSNSNGFTYVSGGGMPITIGTVTKTFLYGTSIPGGVLSGLIARIIPIYGNAYVGVTGSQVFPLQGYVVSSTGTSGQANRKLTVFKGYPQTYLPYLSYGLFVAN